MIFVYNYVRRVELGGDTNMLYNPGVDPEEGEENGGWPKDLEKFLVYICNKTNK